SDGARMEMQLPRLRQARRMRGGAPVFAIAEDRRAECEGVYAQLMGAAGHRLERKPGEAIAGARDRTVIRKSAIAFLIIGCDALAAGPALLGEWLIDLAVARLGSANRDRPIDFVRGFAAEQFAEARGGMGAAR